MARAPTCSTPSPRRWGCCCASGRWPDMLRGNLSTRPFYNERLVTLLILLVAVVALALTAYNGTRLVALSQQRSELKAAIDQNESQSARIRTEADRLQKSIDRSTLNVIAASTREANQII